MGVTAGRAAASRETGGVYKAVPLVAGAAAAIAAGALGRAGVPLMPRAEILDINGACRLPSRLGPCKKFPICCCI